MKKKAPVKWHRVTLRLPVFVLDAHRRLALKKGMTLHAHLRDVVHKFIVKAMAKTKVA